MAHLKNDAILQRDIKKRCKIQRDIKNDAILQRSIKKRCNIARGH
jgi:hypothetical protein